MLDVCLINPPHPYLAEPDAQQPLGLLYVASSCKSSGLSTECWNLTNFSMEEDFSIPEARVFGITGTSLDMSTINKLVKKLQEFFPEALFVVGGPISLSPLSYFSKRIDVIFKGEAENGFPIFVRCIREGKSLESACYASGESSIIKGSKGRYVVIGSPSKDLDALPFPDRRMKGNSRVGGNIFARDRVFLENHISSEWLSATISSSRGCVGNCSFCCAPRLWKGLRFRSPRSLILEIEMLRREFGVSQLRFSDESMTLDIDHLREMCAYLKREKVVWRSSVRVCPSSVEMWRMMKEAGCMEVAFGIESGDPNVLKVLQKGVSVEQGKKAISDAKQAGLVVRALFMVSTPGETPFTFKRNLRYLVETKADLVSITNFVPFPGCDVWENPKKYRCSLVSKNLDDYNLYLVDKEGYRNVRPLIKFDEDYGYSYEDMYSNAEAMRRVVLGLNLVNTNIKRQIQKNVGIESEICNS
jgi:anaerobic magnesium-protoporphyrin IX monomethyl ester cyclase